MSSAAHPFHPTDGALAWQRKMFGASRLLHCPSCGCTLFERPNPKVMVTYTELSEYTYTDPEANASANNTCHRCKTPLPPEAVEAWFHKTKSAREREFGYGNGDKILYEHYYEPNND